MSGPWLVDGQDKKSGIAHMGDVIDSLLCSKGIPKATCFKRSNFYPEETVYAKTEKRHGHFSTFR
jgi:hypothetical protein